MSHPFSSAFLTGQGLPGQYANVHSMFSESPEQAEEPGHLFLDAHFPSEE